MTQSTDHSTDLLEDLIAEDIVPDSPCHSGITPA